MKQLSERQFHSSWLICLMSAGLLAGALVSKYFLTGYLLSFAWIVVALLIAMISLRYQRMWCIALAIIAGVIIGYNRGSHEMIARMDINKYYGQQVEISGRVTEDIDAQKGTVRVKLDNLQVNGASQSGVVWASISENEESRQILRSDKVVLEGKLDEGFATFNGMSYRSQLKKIIREDNADIAREFRDWFADSVRRVIPEPESSLGLGYLVGQKRGLPDDLTEAFIIVGLTHVVVASGYNLTILVRLARRAFGKISRFTALAASSTLVLCFMFVAGFSPSMTRAGLVAGLSLLVWYYGRKIHPIILLFFAAAISVLVEPSYIWGDIGWLLSFGSFAGVLILAPLLQSYFYGDEKPGIIRQVIGETLSAQLATLPLIMLTFGTVSYVALLANVLVLPLIPLAMLLVFLCGILSFVFAPLAWLIAIPTTWLLQYMVWVAKGLAGFSWSYQEISISPIATIAAYCGLGGLLFWLWRSTNLRLERANIVE
jgi:competence protein ComEC